MIFSLNTDDYSAYCNEADDMISITTHSQNNNKFPLIRKLYSVLYDTILSNT